MHNNLLKLTFKYNVGFQRTEKGKLTKRGRRKIYEKKEQVKRADGYKMEQYLITHARVVR